VSAGAVRRLRLGRFGFVRGRCALALLRFRFFLREARAAAFWRFVPKYFNCFALKFRLAILFFLLVAGLSIFVSMF
jgi:hypothetical protein